MSTWTRRQVEQVGGLRAEAAIDPMMVERARVDVLTATRRMLTRRLIDMAHAFVTEPHPADFEFSEALDDDGLIRMRCWWQPATNEVELHGGERDGELLAVRDAPWGTVRVAQDVPSTWFLSGDPDPDITPIEPQIVTYAMTGWREDERRWVYSV